MTDAIEQIRRAHRSAMPNPVANPAWANAERDIGVLLGEIDRQADLIERQHDLMTKAHAVMRACGWQLAIGAEPQSDGVLEAACTEIEAEFAEHLAALSQ